MGTGGATGGTSTGGLKQTGGTGATHTGGTGGTHTGGSGTGGTNTGGTPSRPQCMQKPATSTCSGKTVIDATHLMIDDFEDGNNQVPAIIGASDGPAWWYSYNSTTQSGTGGSAPTLTIESPGAAGTNFCAHTKSIPAAWGGMGMNFTTDTSKMVSCTVDASAFSGITFFIRGDQTAPVTLMVSTEEIVPLTGGGTCVDTGSDTTKCGDAFAKAVPVTATWTQIKVQFSDLKQGDWGCAAQLNLHHFLNFVFGFPANAAIDFEVDQVAFLP